MRLNLICSPTDVTRPFIEKRNAYAFLVHHSLFFSFEQLDTAKLTFKCDNHMRLCDAECIKKSCSHGRNRVSQHEGNLIEQLS